MGPWGARVRSPRLTRPWTRIPTEEALKESNKQPERSTVALYGNHIGHMHPQMVRSMMRTDSMTAVLWGWELPRSSQRTRSISAWWLGQARVKFFLLQDKFV